MPKAALFFIGVIFFLNSCKKEPSFADDMYLFISYEIGSESFEICENILQLEMSCESWDESRFFGSPILNQNNAYNFRAYLGNEVVGNSAPNFSLTLFNVNDLVGTHQIDNGLNNGQIIHNYAVSNNGTVIGAYSTNGTVTITRISNQSYNFNNSNYNILYGDFSAEMRRGGADVQLSGTFQFPIKND